jgi:hypothetical protein
MELQNLATSITWPSSSHHILGVGGIYKQVCANIGYHFAGSSWMRESWSGYSYPWLTIKCGLKEHVTYSCEWSSSPCLSKIKSHENPIGSSRAVWTIHTQGWSETAFISIDISSVADAIVQAGKKLLVSQFKSIALSTKTSYHVRFGKLFMNSDKTRTQVMLAIPITGRGGL